MAAVLALVSGGAVRRTDVVVALTLLLSAVAHLVSHLVGLVPFLLHDSETPTPTVSSGSFL